LFEGHRNLAAPAVVNTVTAECGLADETLKKVRSSPPACATCRCCPCRENFRYLSIQTWTKTKTKTDGGGNSPGQSAKLDYRNARNPWKGEKVTEVSGLGDEAAYLLGGTSDGREQHQAGCRGAARPDHSMISARRPR
jgi:hypothetical protein